MGLRMSLRVSAPYRRYIATTVAISRVVGRDHEDVALVRDLQ